MDFYKSGSDGCSGSRFFSILESNGDRALLGIYPGYISIFYRIFPTNLEIINSDRFRELLNTCDANEIASRKLDLFFNKPLSIWEKLYYNHINPMYVTLYSIDPLMHKRSMKNKILRYIRDFFKKRIDG